MGAFADTLVIIMLVIAAAVFVVLLVTALVQLVQSPYGMYAKLAWLLALLATGPIGMIAWFSVGFKSAQRERSIEYMRRWRKTNQVDTTVDIEEFAEASR
ncbi:MAG TPA: PLDc N-terminal domain-containing protein [Candidatus Agrococcus pullicola]|uniref:PLDc N-terminal domain-containing protein n=1 Tax=Candidatus Agrococcus pullicola TaxID=2838429 RepID=A0A9D1YT61_9MICO|nr:PLDc N-terminal domain-containing protein [Candidatus Agrococcus pullicola]